MKKTIALMAAASLMAIPAMAQLDNPWVNDGAEVGVTINVDALGEVWSSIGSGQARNEDPNVVLDITNSGGIIPQSGIAEDTIGSLANVAYEVSISLDGDIPEWTRLHALIGIDNRGNYDGVNQTQAHIDDAIADNIITWDRRDAADGYIGNQPGDAIPAFTGTGDTSAQSTEVDYAADAIMGMPDVGDADIELVWTIAQQ